MVNIEQLMRLENFFAAEKLDLAYLINSYIEYKEEFELNQVFPFNKYIFIRYLSGTCSRILHTPQNVPGGSIICP